MDNTIREDRSSIYEVGYLIAGLPEEKVADETAKVSGVLAKASASVIAEELPRQEKLAYTMRKKTLSGSYDKYDVAYFGWVKFEVATLKIESIKSQIEAIPSILRILVITAPRENTYLGKHARAIAATFTNRKSTAPGVGAIDESIVGDKKETVIVAPASLEDMDKSIDNMVKEA